MFTDFLDVSLTHSFPLRSLASGPQRMVPRARSRGITWKLVRNANSQVPGLTSDSLTPGWVAVFEPALQGVLACQRQESHCHKQSQGSPECKHTKKEVRTIFFKESTKSENILSE